MTITSLGLNDKYWKPIQVTSLPFVWKSWEAADQAVNGEVGRFIADGMARGATFGSSGSSAVAFGIWCSGASRSRLWRA